MPIFKVDQGKLALAREISFVKEGELQKLTEDNLKTIFGLQFVRREFELGDLRVDTLAFDPETRSFVVLEYKKSENQSLVEQGYAYLALLLNNKADFVLEYNQRTKSNLAKEDVNWAQSRIVFISPRFTKYQEKAIGFKDLPMELWEAHKYDNGTIVYNQLTTPSASESIKTITKSKLAEKVEKEIKVYSEQDHLKSATPEMKELYEILKTRILELGDDIRIKPTQRYIGFKRSTNFTDVEIMKTTLKAHLNAKWGTLDDPKGIARNMKGVGHWGNGEYEVKVVKPVNVEDVMHLVKQTYERW